MTRLSFLAASAMFLAPALSAAAAHAQDASASHTRYPIVLSHHWAGTAEASFLGDVWDSVAQSYAKWGIKQALEREGAIVYQPDKIPYGDHIVRGTLLYKKCEVSTSGTSFPPNATVAEKYALQMKSVNEALCLSGTQRRVDGVELAMADYCHDPAKRSAEYRDEADCIQRVKVNIICHSQGCPDSRYMISGMTNQLSGKPMSQHVASWTSLTGANKGTRLADAALATVGCTAQCDWSLIDQVAAAVGLSAAQQVGSSLFWGPYVLDSIRALTRKYMTQTMDMACDPAKQACAKSFNEAYPNSPNVYYQSYELKIDRSDGCNKEYEARWLLDWTLEGDNDGLIAVESQRFATTGYGFFYNAKNQPTNVVDRGFITGTLRNATAKAYPGMAHMAVSTKGAAGLPGPDCAASSLTDYQFSREATFKSIVHDLKLHGF